MSGESKGSAYTYILRCSDGSLYTGWTYEYVFDNWENCMEMFENGEVDILCNVH